MPCPICQGGYGGRHESWCPRGSWKGWLHWHVSGRFDEAMANFGEIIAVAIIILVTAIAVAIVKW